MILLRADLVKKVNSVIQLESCKIGFVVSTKRMKNIHGLKNPVYVLVRQEDTVFEMSVWGLGL